MAYNEGLNIVSYVLIEIRPLFSKSLGHIIIEKSALLNLGIIIALKNDCDEHLETDKTHYKGKGGEICIGLELASAAYCLTVIINIILIAWIPNTLGYWSR